MAEDKELRGKTAIVTGASSGIGKAIAVRFGGAGAHVVLAGRTRATMEQAAAELTAHGGGATVVALDVRQPHEIRNLIDTAVQRTGRLDIMVNNAGLSYPGTIADGDVEHWREMLETNVLGLLVGCQAAIRAMRACGAQGHIVNISSIAGRSDASGVYGATKAAVNAIATTLRKELEDDTIRVVNILPGAVATSFARHFDPALIAGFAKSMGMNATLTPGSHVPEEVLARMQQVAAPMLAAADDVANAVYYAVTQPIQLNIFEMVVRPQKQLQL